MSSESTIADITARRVETSRDLSSAIKGLRRTARDKTDLAVLADLGVALFRKGTVFVSEDFAGNPVSINASYVGSRRKNVWEPYLNIWTAYTAPEFRRRGLATHLERIMEKYAMDCGCRRLRSMAGTRLGLYWHRSLRHDIWVRTSDTNLVAIDHPLIGRLHFPVIGTPMSVRKWTTAERPRNSYEVEELFSTPLAYEVLEP